MTKKFIWASSDTSGVGAEKKREKYKRALLADVEKCCKLTDLFLNSSAASASISANTASMLATQLSQHTREKDRTVRNMRKRKNKTSKRRMKR